MTTGLKTNYDTERYSSEGEKIKNCRQQNTEDETNNMQLDKEDTQTKQLER